MHALKGNWIGQTFVHAKYNDSGERRSRIRRSKEERKAMVESFIKKHQVLNSGSFPSLNLTHKEVGGSFYTVREIIREIIQENKVLGPAKLTQGGENQVNILEHYPIGSISIQPEIDSLALDAAESEHHKKPNYAYNLSEEHPFNTNLVFDESERWVFADNENISTSSLLMKKHAYEDEAEVNEILEMEKMLEVSVVSEGEANAREILTTKKILEDSITSEGEATATTMDTQMEKKLEKLEALAAEVAGKELDVVGGSEALAAEVTGKELDVVGGSEALAAEVAGKELDVVGEPEALSAEVAGKELDVVGEPEVLSAEVAGKELEVVGGSEALAAEVMGKELEVAGGSEALAAEVAGKELDVVGGSEALAAEVAGKELEVVRGSEVLAAEVAGKELEVLGGSEALAAEVVDKELEVVGGSEALALAAEVAGKELEVVRGSEALAAEVVGKELEVVGRSEALAAEVAGKELEVLGRSEALAAEVVGKELEVVGGTEASKDGVTILTKEKNVAVENVPEVREAKFTSIASDLNVETFPVPVSKTIHGRDDITVTPEQDFDEDNEMSFTKSPIPSSQEEEDTHLKDKIRVQESEKAHMGISNGYAVRKDDYHEEKSALHVEIKPSSNEEAVNLQSGYQKITHDVGNREKENTPTLDRINLESWKGSSKKSRVQQINDPFAFMKAIIAAFIKFWSE